LISIFKSAWAKGNGKLKYKFKISMGPIPAELVGDKRSLARGGKIIYFKVRFKK
jgi:hypothetical protein